MLHTDMLMGGYSFESLSMVFAEIGLVWSVVTARRALSTHPCSTCNKPGLMVEHGVGSVTLLLLAFFGLLLVLLVKGSCCWGWLVWETFFASTDSGQAEKNAWQANFKYLELRNGSELHHLDAISERKLSIQLVSSRVRFLRIKRPPCRTCY